ncbi:hypothetical protein ACQ4PT_032184 [Festuca glaucescens]
MGDPRLYPSGSAPRRHLYNPYQDLNIPSPARTSMTYPPPWSSSSRRRPSCSAAPGARTGIGYLSGALVGAAMGLREAARVAEPGDTAKIWANRVLNSCGATGRRMGNRLGVIGLLYLEKEQMFGMAEKEMEYRVDLFNR